MKPQLQLYIPQPCHEDWNKMTPVDKGRSCESCNKQVVDFSVMSDQQVLHYFSNTTGKTCGRFAEDQLQRALIPTKIEKKKAWLIALMLPLLLLFDKTNAQKKNINSKQATPAMIKQDPKAQIMGKIATPVMIDSFILVGEVAVEQECKTLIGDTVITTQDPQIINGILIKGKLTDVENGEAIAYATVSIKGEDEATISDKDGNFNLLVPSKEKEVSFIISSIGYLQKEVTIPLNDHSNNISLKQDVNLLPEVIVVSQELITCSRMTSGEVVVVAGYAVAHQPVKKIDTIHTIIRKAFRNEPFKAYPNPISKGGLLHIEIRKTGEYSIQIVDNTSKILFTNVFIAATDHAVASIDIPSTFAVGVYYIRVVDQRKKRSYVDKIIVQ